MPASETAAEKATAPTTAIGYTQAQTYQQMWSEEELTPELQWPQSIAVFDQMRRTDSQCASVLRAVTLPVRRTPWRIDPNGARPEVVELVADDLGLPIVGQKPKAPLRTKDKFSWPEHLRLALLMLPMGHSYFEQVYRVDESGSVAHLRKLEFRPSRTIEDIKVASDGGLISIKQYWTKENTAPRPIPVNRLVAYIHEREGGNWLGTSILRSAYKNFLLKERLLRVQAQTIERNGMGIPLYKAQEGASGDDLTAGKAMATAWRAGEAAGSAVPFGADLVLRGVEGTLPDALPVVQYHDEAIARAVLAHFLNLGTQTGSWALGTTFADFFTLSLQTLAQQIADTATQHIIEDLVDVNFGPQEPAPRLVFDEIGSRQAATAQALKLLVDAKLITPDQVLDETVRQQYGLPPADPETAIEPEVPAEPVLAPDLAEAGFEAPVTASAKTRRPVRAKRTVKDPRTAAIATLRRLRGRLSGALLRELDAIIALLADGSKITAHLAGEHNQETHGRRRTGTLGSVLGKLESLRGKLSDEDRSVLDRAMEQLRELESSDVDDDDLIDEEPDEPDEEDEDEDTDLVMDSASGELSFEPWTDGDVTVDWDGGGIVFTPVSGREVAEAVDRFASLPVAEMPEIPYPPGWGEWSFDERSDWLRTWYASPEWVAYKAVVGEAATSDGGLKVQRYRSGEYAIGDAASERVDDDSAALQLDGSDEGREFAEKLREALAAAKPAVTASALRRNIPVVAHGSHDQSTHGRKGPNVRVPKAPRSAGPAKKTTPVKKVAPAKAPAAKSAASDARLKLERAEEMFGPDRSKWSKRNQNAAAKLEKTISDSEPSKLPAKKAAPRAKKPAPGTSAQAQKARAAALGSHADPESREELSGGALNDGVHILTFPDGSKAVRKKIRHVPVGEVWERSAVTLKDQLDAEELSSLLAVELGLVAPAVHRESDNSMLMDHMGGKLAILSDDAERKKIADGMADKAKVALFDALIHNKDRNPGNWLIGDDGRPQLIDHSLAFGYDGLPENAPNLYSEFADALISDGFMGTKWKTNAFTQRDIRVVKQRLKALKPEFDRLERGPWLGLALRRIDAIREYAKGEVDLIA